MARTDTLPHFLTDVADAIRTKGGTSDPIQASSFDTAIADLPSGSSGFTGHYDATGLAQIGWTTDDINYYQDNAVLWNSENDDDYKLRADEIDGSAGLKSRFMLKSSTLANGGGMNLLIGVPMIDTSSQTNWSGKFQNCYNLITIPLWNASSATNMSNMFNSCFNLRSIPLLNTSSVTDMSYMFNSCYSLREIPLLDTNSVTNMTQMFYYCECLRDIPQLDTGSVTNFSYMFGYCYTLTSVPILDTSSATSMAYMFSNCYSLSNNALNNILQMCINATHITHDKKLSVLGIPNSRFGTRIQALSNYQAFLNAGWTIS